MISEVLLNLLMITCILMWVSSKEVKWTMCDTPKIGRDLPLFCEVDNVTGTKIWRGGPDDKVLMVNSGVSTDKAKYNTAIDKNGFFLTILNLTVEDLNVSYECSCGFYLDNHILYMEDVYKVHKLNKTTNGTNYVGTNYARMPFLKMTLSITISIVLLPFVVFIIKNGSLKRFREKFVGSRKTKSDADDNPNLTGLLLQTVHVDFNLRQSSDKVDSQNVTDSFLHTIPVDFNQRKSSDSSLQSADVNLNQIQCTDKVDSQNVTDSFLHTIPVDFNQRKSSDSSLQSADVNLNRIQCTDEDVTPSSEQDIDHDLLIKNVTAVESFAPSSCQEIRNEIGKGKTDR